MKKTISALILIIAILSLSGCVIRKKLPPKSGSVSESAEGDILLLSPDTSSTVGDFVIKRAEGGAELVRCTENSESIVIPDKIGGLPIVSIGKEAFAGHKELTSVTLPDSVLEIGGEAFSDCRMLSRITLPQNLVKIGDFAFANCVKLENIDLPDPVREIGTYAFYNCYVLKAITIPHGVTDIADGTFFNCSELSLVTLPTALETIGRDAFYNCFELKSIELPDSLFYLDRRPFEGCFNLGKITYKGKEYCVFIGDDDYDHMELHIAVNGQPFEEEITSEYQ